MDKETRKKWVFLQEQHLAVCFDQGEQPDEFCSPYSAGADALQRVAAIDRKIDVLIETAMRLAIAAPKTNTP